MLLAHVTRIVRPTESSIHYLRNIQQLSMLGQIKQRTQKKNFSYSIFLFNITVQWLSIKGKRKKNRPMTRLCSFFLHQFANPDLVRLICFESYSYDAQLSNIMDYFLLFLLITFFFGQIFLRFRFVFFEFHSNSN